MQSQNILCPRCGQDPGSLPMPRLQDEDKILLGQIDTASAECRQNVRYNIDSAISSCIAAIDAYQSTLRSLSSSRNSCADVSTLPDDVLGEIMWLTIPKGDEDRKRLGSLKVLPLSHVSHHWRNVAISYPKLWSRITMACLVSKDLVDTILGCAKSYPLDLNLYWQTTPLDRVARCWKDLSSRRPRIRNLALDSAGLDDDFLLAIFSEINSESTASNLLLRSLTLKLVGPRGEHREKILPIALPTISEFALSTYPATDSAPVSMTWLTVTLRTMLMLKKLTLSGVFLPLPVPDDHYDPISLPQLTELYVVGRMLHLKWILEHVAVPRHADVHLSCITHHHDHERWRGHVASAASIASFLSSRFTSADLLSDAPAYMACLNIIYPYKFDRFVFYRLVLQPVRRLLSTKTRGSDLDPDASIGKLALSFGASTPQYVADVWAALPLERVYSLKLLDGAESEAAWSEHLTQGFVAQACARMHRVEALATRWPPQLLRRLLSQGTHGDPSSFLFPELTTLSLHNVRDEKARKAMNEVVVDLELEARRGPLKCISFPGCDHPDEVVQGLKSEITRW
ncbi:hypothetical protein EIP91_004019 [Steccherinum ochraceum]|uniref:F-box domain-containing protein n=1 Tax=Steccherinum ochraceum TaxID=92696 RepID=A0A4R0R9J5_9APHY|nr:hypothetical protein EIP91_004019 [Steccherinum ochraceum]